MKGLQNEARRSILPLEVTDVLANFQRRTSIDDLKSDLKKVHCTQAQMFDARNSVRELTAPC